MNTYNPGAFPYAYDFEKGVTYASRSSVHHFAECPTFWFETASVFVLLVSATKT
jgi:hypothetical protein